MKLLKIKTALISLSDKSNLSDVLKTLSKNNIKIISSGGTYKYIKKLGYHCIEVSKYTGFKEMLGGRVKTLHPKIHAGILNDRSNKKHKSEMNKQGFPSIDLIIVNFYPFQETVTRFVEDFDGKVTQQLRMGISNGETISELTQRVRGVINTKANTAKTISRTVQTAVSAEIREETFDNNSDVVKGYEWVSVLDTRTSDICRALDGTEYELDDPKRRVPPAHPNCRSTITPVLKSWKELGLDIDELDDETRRDMNGESVSAELDYGEWLKTQDDKVQNEALGKAKAKLFRDNNLDMKDFVNRIGEPLTVAEVKEKLARRKRRN